MRLKNPKSKGSRLERCIRDILRNEGYLVVKAGGSLGPVDIVGLNLFTGAVRLIQSKANHPPGPDERAALAALADVILPANRARWKVQVWVKVDRKPWQVSDVAP